MLLVETNEGTGFVCDVVDDSVVVDIDGDVQIVESADCEFYDDINEGRLSYKQIRWLFWHKCAKGNPDGTITVNWNKAYREGWNNQSGGYDSNPHGKNKAPTKIKSRTGKKVALVAAQSGFKADKVSGKYQSNRVKMKGGGSVTVRISPNNGKIDFVVKPPRGTKKAQRDAALKKMQDTVAKSLGVGAKRSKATGDVGLRRPKDTRKLRRMMKDFEKAMARSNPYES